MSLFKSWRFFLKKVIGCIILIIMLGSTLAGCLSKSKPDQVVLEFLRAFNSFDIETMMTKINPDNALQDTELSELLSEKEDNYQKYFLEYLKTNAMKTTYVISDIQIDGETAKIKVNFKYVDGGPLLKATFVEVITKAFAMAFSGTVLSDDASKQFFVTTMQEKEKTVTETFVEKTVIIECVYLMDKWYINQLTDDLMDVFMSNFISVGKDMENSF